ncbi:hypothetical protein THAOC_10047, partial [Thalassiosira oceanica]
MSSASSLPNCPTVSRTACSSHSAVLSSTSWSMKTALGRNLSRMMASSSRRGAGPPVGRRGRLAGLVDEPPPGACEDLREGVGRRGRGLDDDAHESHLALAEGVALHPRGDLPLGEGGGVPVGEEAVRLVARRRLGHGVEEELVPRVRPKEGLDRRELGLEVQREGQRDGPGGAGFRVVLAVLAPLLLPALALLDGVLGQSRREHPVHEELGREEHPAAAVRAVVVRREDEPPEQGVRPLERVRGVLRPEAQPPHRPHHPGGVEAEAGGGRSSPAIRAQSAPPSSPATTSRTAERRASSSMSGP